MTSRLRTQFILIVLLTSIAAGIALPIPNKAHWPLFSKARIQPGIDLAGGGELRYKVLFDPKFSGDREKATRDAADVLRRRLEALQLKEPKVTTHGDDEIVLQLPGVDAQGLREYRGLIEGVGKLELYAASTADLQERFEREGIVPEGYRAVQGPGTSAILVEKLPVIEGRHIIAAQPRQQMGPEGASWVTEFELDSEGARRFDEAAERLYRRSPRGRIVVVLDDKVRSAPMVNSPAFHGRGQISFGEVPRK
jgi:preprotein translocase subunit SecD